jgi:hypothetical protein
MAPNTAPPAPTIWAQKYGVAREKWLQHYGKSGISPLLLFNALARPPRTLQEWKLRSLADLYQRTNFEGFTTRNMIRAGAIGEQISIRPSDLTEIHPLFARERWHTALPRHLAFYPLGHGNPGYWKADNDEVWKVLKPCLALASRFVDNTELWYW